MSRVIAKVRELLHRAPSEAPKASSATASDVAFAVRFVLVVGGIGVLGLLKVSVTSACQQIAVEIDRQHSAMTRAEIARERLLVERAMLRQPERLQRAADTMGLTAPVAVIAVPGAR